MIKIDLIIPSLISYQKYPEFQNFRRFLKFQEIPFPSWSGNWFPIWLNLRNLKKMDVDVRFLNYKNIEKKRLANIVGVDSRIINNLIFKYGYVSKTLKKEIIPLLKKLRKKVEYLFYFDNSDSTGHFHSEVFPYVDRYFKKQMLKDREIYKKNLYGKRLFSDFYARNYNLNKKNESKEGFELVLKYQNKIALSWNFAFKDYRYSTLLTRFLYGLTRKNNITFYPPNRNRKIILAANFSIKPSYNLIYFQRNQLLRLLKEKFNSNPKFCIGKIPKKEYLKTMRTSKTIISPYGWGEICYRDFETFIAGGALIKPDMDHLDTWPNFYKKDRTYLSLPWKLELWNDAITEILSDEDNLLDIAREGQKSYKKIWTLKGNIAFCEHFIKMITFD